MKKKIFLILGIGILFIGMNGITKAEEGKTSKVCLGGKCIENRNIYGEPLYFENFSLKGYNEGKYSNGSLGKFYVNGGDIIIASGRGFIEIITIEGDSIRVLHRYDNQSLYDPYSGNKYLVGVSKNYAYFLKKTGGAGKFKLIRMDLTTYEVVEGNKEHNIESQKNVIGVIEKGSTLLYIFNNKLYAEDFNKKEIYRVFFEYKGEQYEDNQSINKRSFFVSDRKIVLGNVSNLGLGSYKTILKEGNGSLKIGIDTDLILNFGSGKSLEFKYDSLNSGNLQYIELKTRKESNKMIIQVKKIESGYDNCLLKGIENPLNYMYSQALENRDFLKRVNCSGSIGEKETNLKNTLNLKERLDSFGSIFINSKNEVYYGIRFGISSSVIGKLKGGEILTGGNEGNEGDDQEKIAKDVTKITEKIVDEAIKEVIPSVERKGQKAYKCFGFEDDKDGKEGKQEKTIKELCKLNCGSDGIKLCMKCSKSGLFEEDYKKLMNMCSFSTEKEEAKDGFNGIYEANVTEKVEDSNSRIALANEEYGFLGCGGGKFKNIGEFYSGIDGITDIGKVFTGTFDLLGDLFNKIIGVTKSIGEIIALFLDIGDKAKYTFSSLSSLKVEEIQKILETEGNIIDFGRFEINYNKEIEEVCERMNFEKTKEICEKIKIKPEHGNKLRAAQIKTFSTVINAVDKAIAFIAFVSFLLYLFYKNKGNE